MINDDEDILDIDAFTKLIKTVQDFNNFESHKKLFLCGFFFASEQKREHK